MLWDLFNLTFCLHICLLVTNAEGHLLAFLLKLYPFLLFVDCRSFISNLLVIVTHIRPRDTCLQVETLLCCTFSHFVMPLRLCSTGVYRIFFCNYLITNQNYKIKLESCSNRRCPAGHNIHMNSTHIKPQSLKVP